MSSVSERVVVFDTTLRDGEQTAGVCFSAAQKVEIAQALAAMRVDVIEAGFPAASAAERRAVNAVAREVRGASVCALARAVPFDVDAAAEALRGAEAPRIHTFVNASDVQLAHQLRKGRDEVLGMVEYAVDARAQRHRRRRVQPDGRDARRPGVPRRRRARGARGRRAHDQHSRHGRLCAPDQVAALIAQLFARVPELAEAVVSFHGQDDLGLATANALAAIRAGARQVELAVNGIGERAGNTAFEEVVMAISVHGEALGVHTAVDPRGICALSALVERHSGVAVPRNKAVVGANAFRHASGIHQDGVLKWRENYEVLDPAAIGHARGTEIVLGKLSGRAGFVARAKQLGFCLHRCARSTRAFDRFQRLADDQPVVEDDDLRSICAATCEPAHGATARAAGGTR